MIEQWLEPVIEQRSHEIAEHKLKHDHYQAFIELLEKKDEMEDAEFKYEMENLFVLHTRSVVKDTYRIGVLETLNFKKFV